MKIKNLALATAALLGLVGAPAAFACSTAAWASTGAGGGEVGNPTEGRPSTSPPVSRYSGQCGLKSTATGQYVVDVTPAAETSFRARFYVFTGLASGSATVFRAANGTDQTMISIVYNRDTNQFLAGTNGAPVALSGAVTADRWYAVELNWSRTAGMTVTARGAGTTTDITTAAAIPAANTDQIDVAQLGWVSGAGVVSAAGPLAGRAIVTDAYESRRSTAIGRLCRADANNSSSITAGDRTAITLELGGTLAAGQPDCNEDGNVSAGDRTCVTQLLAAGASCN